MLMYRFAYILRFMTAGGNKGCWMKERRRRSCFKMKFICTFFINYSCLGFFHTHFFYKIFGSKKVSNCMGFLSATCIFPIYPIMYTIFFCVPFLQNNVLRPEVHAFFNGVHYVAFFVYTKTSDSLIV